MSRFNIVFGLVLFASVAILFSACKKSRETPAFTFSGPTDIYLEYDQDFATAYSTTEIKSIELSDIPNGWRFVNSGSAIVITAPSQSAVSGGSADSSGSATVTANTSAGTTITRTLTVAVKVATDLTPNPTDETANCYIASTPDERYKFNARRKGHESAESMTPAAARLVWCTVKGGVSHVIYNEGNLYFSTSKDDNGDLVECNALVAAVNSDDEIIWSWHIWVTDYDPALNTHSVTMGSFPADILMDRNLGAFGNSHVDGGADLDDTYKANILASYGLYYQWGRKDPFVGPVAFRSTTGAAMYNASGSYQKVTAVECGAETGTIAYSIANPLTIIYGVEASGWDWLYAARRNDLWGNANMTRSGTVTTFGTKTIYDPCPAGWMVAPPRVWSNFTNGNGATGNTAYFNINTADGFRDGWTFLGDSSADMFYPAGGRYSFKSGKLTLVDGIDNINSTGYYWSNSNYSATLGAVLSFNQSFINPATENNSNNENADSEIIRNPLAEISRAGACPVRCAQIP